MTHGVAHVILSPCCLFVVLARTGQLLVVVLLDTTYLVQALETLDSRGKACVRFHELDPKFIQSKALQRLGTLHVFIDLVEAVRDVVAARARRVVVRHLVLMSIFLALASVILREVHMRCRCRIEHFRPLLSVCYF